MMTCNKVLLIFLFSNIVQMQKSKYAKGKIINAMIENKYDNY
jgi:hypothetical protein